MIKKKIEQFGAQYHKYKDTKLKGYSKLSLYRWFPLWCRTQGKSPIDFHLPWINFFAKDFLTAYVNKETIVFEYGSGGSTLFLQDKVKKVYSVEHNEDWYRLLLVEINQNVDMAYVPPKKIEVPSGDRYTSRSAKYKDFDFEDYVNQITKHKKETFDLIIIDGRARNKCLEIARQYVKVGGLILLDNSEREYYTENIDMKGFKKIVSFGPLPYSPYFSETTFFIKS